MKCTWEGISECIESADKEVFLTFIDSISKNVEGLAIISIKGTSADLLHLSTLDKEQLLNACR